MKIVCFLPPGQSEPHHGALLDGGRLLDFSLLDLVAPATWLDRTTEAFAAASRATENPPESAVLPLADVRLLSPVPRPGKVICIGLNYKDHAEESGMDLPERPLVFSKFPTSVVGPDAEVILPPGSSENDYEAELGVVIGKTATRIDAAAAMEHVLGYTNLNDVSARDFQFADGQWQRGKSPDTFCPMGPAIVTTDEVTDPHVLRIQLRLNGNTMQDSSTDQLIFQVPELLAELSNFTTLEPGDVIATGTPPGVGFARKPPVYIQAGDVMEVEIEGLGVLRNPVVR